MYKERAQRRRRQDNSTICKNLWPTWSDFLPTGSPRTSYGPKNQAQLGTAKNIKRNLKMK